MEYLGGTQSEHVSPLLYEMKLGVPYSVHLLITTLRPINMHLHIVNVGTGRSPSAKGSCLRANLQTPTHSLMQRDSIHSLSHECEQIGLDPPAEEGLSHQGASSLCWGGIAVRGLT